MRMALATRPATEADLPLLARMNKHLIEDEGSRNPMSLDQLAERMRGWVLGDWGVKLFLAGETIVGYAVYQLRRDEYFPQQTIVYLRQLFVERDRRSRGLGAEAVALLVQEHFPPGCTVVIDALASNPRGAAFWQKVGFAPYCATMHLRPR
jgi:GNAT superfamily N-acetyltransferase